MTKTEKAEVTAFGVIMLIVLPGLMLATELAF